MNSFFFTLNPEILYGIEVKATIETENTHTTFRKLHSLVLKYVQKHRRMKISLTRRWKSERRARFFAAHSEEKQKRTKNRASAHAHAALTVRRGLGCTRATYTWS